MKRIRRSTLQSDFTGSIKYRAILIFSVFTFFFIVFAYRAFRLQISQNDLKLKHLLDNQLTSRIKLTPRRGEILDAGLRELAMSIRIDSLYAHPRQLKNKIKVARFLSDTLILPEGKILAKFNSKKKFVWIKRLLTPDTVEKIKAKSYPGLHFISESKRFYPNKHLAAQMVGFVGLDSKGLEGLELQYDRHLTGERHLYRVQTDAFGRPILAILEKNQNPTSSEMLFTNYISKENLVLTIDKDLQYQAEKELERAIIASDAPRGEVIVLNPQNGKILALAHYPFFNPNNYARYPRQLFRIRAITDMFDPGSTFKLITVAAALDQGKITPNTHFDCENGIYPVSNGKKIREAMQKKFGSLTVTEIIQHSSNIGIVKIAENLDKKVLYDYILKFGFDSRTGINLPGEASGKVRSPENWNAVDRANISFGQGISVTSIQMVSAIAAIVNGGTLYRPYLVDKILDNKLNLVKEFQPVVLQHNIIKKKTSDEMKSIMEKVCSPEGTGKLASIPGVRIGGKTGTAQKFNYSKFRYYSNRYISSFAGVFPLDNPEYIIFVKIDDPLKNKYASHSAAPAFKNIATHLLDKIPHDRDVRRVKAPAITPLHRNLTETFKPEKIIKLKTMKEGKQRLVRVPNLKKMSLRQALRIFNRHPFDFHISGTGKVANQDPEPGKYVAKGSQIKIILKK